MQRDRTYLLATTYNVREGSRIRVYKPRTIALYRVLLVTTYITLVLESR